MADEEKYYGKYRGTVTSIADPQKMGRLKANVPSINGSFETGWCLPCFPYAGADHCCQFMPHIGDVVWIEFERGKLEYPIWVGSPMCIGQDKYRGCEHILRTPHGQLLFMEDGTVVLCNNRLSGLIINPEQVAVFVNGGAGTIYTYDMAHTVAPKEIKSESKLNQLLGNVIKMKGNAATFADSAQSWTPSELKAEIEVAKTLP